MITPVSMQQLVNAGADCNTIAAIATSTAETVVDRLGQTKLTMVGACNKIGFEQPYPYQTSGQTLNRPAQTVSNGGLVYAPALGTAFPFTTSGAFNTSLWRVISVLDTQKILETTQLENVAALKNFTPVEDGHQVTTSGYYVAGDGAGATYVARIPSSAVDNGGDIIKTTAGVVFELVDKSNITMNLFGARAGPAYDCSPALRSAIARFPFSKIKFLPSTDGYYFNSELLDPASASYTIEGDDSLQSSSQTRFVVNFNGNLFHTASTNTVFTVYKNIRFVSNKISFPLARAIYNEGDYVHGSMENICVQNFAKPAIEILKATNACTFEKILVMFCDDYGLKVNAGSANKLSNITGDNTGAGALYCIGGSNTFTNLYSEDCCKLNVSAGKTFREFLISGDANIINGCILNSFAGNTTPPVSIDVGRNTTIIGMVNKSSSVPSYPYDIEMTATSSSITLINSTAITTGNQNKNVITIDAGYTSTNPTIKMGKFDLEKGAPLARLAWNGSTGAIKQGYNILGVTKISTGIFDISFVGTGYVDGMIIVGNTDNGGYALPISCNEVLGGRTSTKFRMETRRADGVLVDTQFCSVLVYGEQP